MLEHHAGILADIFNFNLEFTMSLPSNKIAPPVGSSSKLIQRSSVDFPEPEEPIMVTTSPFFYCQGNILKDL